MRLTNSSQHTTDGLPPEFGGPAEQYQIATRNPSYTKRFSKAHETHYQPWIQRLVADAPLHLDTGVRIALPPARADSLTMPLGEAITNRRSGRIYGSTPIPPADLSTLLVTSLGVRHSGPTGSGAIRRNVTNSGNLGSVEIYPILLRVEGIGPGIYHFDSVHHDLALIRQGDFTHWLREIVLYQIEFADAAVALVLTSAFGRLKAKYGPRGYRLALFDIGHTSQNVYLTATGLGLQVCATAGFVDDVLNTALSLDGIDTGTSLVMLLGTTP